MGGSPRWALVALVAVVRASSSTGYTCHPQDGHVGARDRGWDGGRCWTLRLRGGGRAIADRRDAHKNAEQLWEQALDEAGEHDENEVILAGFKDEVRRQSSQREAALRESHRKLEEEARGQDDNLRVAGMKKWRRTDKVRDKPEWMQGLDLPAPPPQNQRQQHSRTSDGSQPRWRGGPPQNTPHGRKRHGHLQAMGIAPRTWDPLVEQSNEAALAAQAAAREKAKAEAMKQAKKTPPEPKCIECRAPLLPISHAQGRKSKLHAAARASWTRRFSPSANPFALTPRSMTALHSPWAPFCSASRSSTAAGQRASRRFGTGRRCSDRRSTRPTRLLRRESGPIRRPWMP